MLSRRSIVSICIKILIMYFLSNTVLAQPTALVDSVVSPVTYVVCLVYLVMTRVAGAIAGLVFVIAGVKWVASADNPGERKQAKDTMKNAIIGLIIIMVAAQIISAVGTQFAFTCG